MASPAANPWIAHATRRPGARLALVCFPYAGGSAIVYRGWGSELPAAVEVLPVELPGRAGRLREPPFTRLSELIPALAAGLAPELGKPFALFGHSMGGLVAFELARHLRRQGQPGPRALLVSGRRAPQLPDPEQPVHTLPEDEFIAKLRTLNGTPEEVFGHPELLQLLLPVLRADFEVNETYEHRPEPPLSCPLVAFGGSDDPEVRPEHLDGWREHTAGGFRLRLFPGDHFYFVAQRSAVLAALAGELIGPAGGV